MPVQTFGFTFVDRGAQQRSQAVRSPIEPMSSEGTMNVAALDAFGTPVAYTMDLTNSSTSEVMLIEKYRDIAMIPEVDRAIEEILSEAIIGDTERPAVTINLDMLEIPETIKTKIEDGFDHILGLLKFNHRGYDIFRRWYIDGRIYYHILIDEKNPRKGIQELRYIDPRKIKRVREAIRQMGQNQTQDMANLSQTEYKEYYVYNRMGLEASRATTSSQVTNSGAMNMTGSVRIAKEAISTSNSGMMDPSSNIILSFLHKALRPANNLRMMEDSLVIYRLTRAPERRIFYVDVGNLPKGRSEQYMKQIMTKYKNKLVYDSTTGEIRDDRRHLAMTEDYWIPRREGSRGTEIDTLPGGQNLSDIEDVEYFKKKLHESLNVPLSRLATEPSMFSQGTEISRDELKFSRFVSRVRSRFSELFADLLGKHLVLTGVMSWEFWEKISGRVIYDFQKDNHFAEAIEHQLMQQRMDALNEAAPYVGQFFSKEYIWKKILRLTDDEVKEMKAQIDQEVVDTPSDQQQSQEQPQQAQEDVNFVDVHNLTESEAQLAESMAGFFKAMTSQVSPTDTSELTDDWNEPTAQ